MKFVKLGAENDEPRFVALGFSDKHDAIMAHFVSERLENEYVSIYFINLETDTYEIYRAPYTTKTMFRKDNCWSKAVTDFAKECAPEHQKMVLTFAKMETLKEKFIGTDRHEFNYRHNYGENKWRRSIYTVLERRNGAPIRLLATFMIIEDYQAKNLDLNEQILAKNKELEEKQGQLETALQQASEANRAKTTFLFNMSHDIRTPMNAIIGFAKLAKKHIDEREQAIDCLSKVESSSDYLLRIINDILEMARIESGKIDLDALPVDIMEHKDSVAMMLESLANSKNIEFVKEYRINKSHIIYADYVRVDQILVNLLSNAIKYTPNGGRVLYRVEEEDSLKEGYVRLKFTIADNGIGMSKDFVRTIFEAFSREKSSTVSGIQGTGLGMAIVKRLVDLMGGTIDIESEVGKGTTITMWLDLPIAKKILKAENKIESVSLADISGIKVLLVEDNELNAEIATELMKEMGAKVTHVSDGMGAVELMAKAKKGDFDVILMDIQMPIMNGYKATQAIRQLPDKDVAAIPIIAMTANVFAEDKKKAKEAGMNGHLSKPINVNKMVEILARYIG